MNWYTQSQVPNKNVSISLEGGSTHVLPIQHVLRVVLLQTERFVQRILSSNVYLQSEYNYVIKSISFRLGRILFHKNDDIQIAGFFGNFSFLSQSPLQKSFFIRPKLRYCKPINIRPICFDPVIFEMKFGLLVNFFMFSIELIIEK